MAAARITFSIRIMDVSVQARLRTRTMLQKIWWIWLGPQNGYVEIITIWGSRMRKPKMQELAESQGQRWGSHDHLIAKRVGRLQHICQCPWWLARFLWISKEWKKYICKRQPVIETVFYFTDEIGDHVGNDGCGIPDSRKEKIPMKLYIGLWSQVSSLTTKRSIDFPWQ